MVQHQEAAEREQHASGQGRDGREAQPPQEPVRASEGGGVRGQELEIERNLQRKDPVEQQVPGMEQPELPLAMKVEACEQRGGPQQGITVLQRPLVQVPQGHVIMPQVVEDEDASGDQRPG